MTFKTTKKCCSMAYAVQALAINFAPLLFVIFKNTYNISYTLIGMLAAMNFAVQMIVDFISVFFLDSIGYRRSIVLSQFCCASGLWLLAVLPNIMPPYIGICISTILYSVGAGLIEVGVNPIISGLPKECGKDFMLTHSFYSIGHLTTVLVTTIIIKIFGTDSWMVIAPLWGVIPFVNGLFFLKTPILPPVEKENARGIVPLLKNRVFLIILTMMFLAGATELTMAQWISAFAQNALGVDKFTGDLIGPSMFAFFMGVGRLVYVAFKKKINYIVFTSINCLVCSVCYLVAAISGNAIVALVSCALFGFCVSTLWPGTVEVADEKFPDGGGAMYSAIAICGDVGGTVAPFITGFVASMGILGNKALNVGLGLNMVYPILFIVALRLLKK